MKIKLDINIGDVLLAGRYKNKRIVVKKIGKDDLGQPTINGDPILKFRIEKHLPDDKKSKKTDKIPNQKKIKIGKITIYSMRYKAMASNLL